MNDKESMNDDLLVKYLVGEATPEESAAMEHWINAQPANRLQYDQFKRIWEESLLVAGTRPVDEDAAYNRLQQRLQGSPAEGRTGGAKVMSIQKKKLNWLAIAAAAIVICSAGYFAATYFKRPATVINIASNNSVLTDTLPDGSVITLNKLSKFAYPQNFKGDTRTVSLQGEAFFKVTPDKSKPFIINVNDVTVRVVGTSFNVKSRDGKTEVIVETGIVNVKKAGSQINLKPGEKIETNKRSDGLDKQDVRGKLYRYYTNGELICDRTPLIELVQALSEFHGVKIVIANKQLEQMPITTVFKNKSLEQVLTVVSLTLKITVEKRADGSILLK